MIETTREREFGTPAARVFRALVEPRQLTQWFCDEAEVQLRDGGRYAFGGARAYGGPQTAEGRILRITPDRQLSFNWPLAGVESEVQYDLAERSGRCLITVRHTGVRALPIVAEWPEQHLKVVWDIFLRQLEGYLAGHPVPPMEFPYVPAPVVTHDIIIEAPEDRVWEMLTVPTELNRWMAKEAYVELRAGGRYSYGWAEEQTSFWSPAHRRPRSARAARGVMAQRGRHERCGDVNPSAEGRGHAAAIHPPGASAEARDPGRLPHRLVGVPDGSEVPGGGTTGLGQRASPDSPSPRRNVSGGALR